VRRGRLQGEFPFSPEDEKAGEGAIPTRRN